MSIEAIEVTLLNSTKLFQLMNLKIKKKKVHIFDTSFLKLLIIFLELIQKQQHLIRNAWLLHSNG